MSSEVERYFFGEHFPLLCFKEARRNDPEAKIGDVPYFSLRESYPTRNFYPFFTVLVLGNFTHFMYGKFWVKKL
jgi:hypothetical protein